MEPDCYSASVVPTWNACSCILSRCPAGLTQPLNAEPRSRRPKLNPSSGFSVGSEAYPESLGLSGVAGKKFISAITSFRSDALSLNNLKGTPPEAVPLPRQLQGSVRHCAQVTKCGEKNLPPGTLSFPPPRPSPQHVSRYGTHPRGPRAFSDPNRSKEVRAYVHPLLVQCHLFAVYVAFIRSYESSFSPCGRTTLARTFSRSIVRNQRSSTWTTQRNTTRISTPL